MLELELARNQASKLKADQVPIPIAKSQYPIQFNVRIVSEFVRIRRRKFGHVNANLIRC